MPSESSSQREPAAEAYVAPPAAAAETRAEQFARIARVLWSTPLAADTEPWTTPGRVTATVAQDNGRGR